MAGTHKTSVLCVPANLLLMSLLAAQHRNVGFAQSALAPLAYVEPLFIAVIQFTYREMHVADAAARAVLLAGYMTVLREELLQAGDQFFKIERTRVIATRSNDWQHTCIITGACLTTIDKRTPVTVPRPQTIIRTGCILHTLKGLQICHT